MGDEMGYMVTNMPPGTTQEKVASTKHREIARQQTEHRR